MGGDQACLMVFSIDWDGDCILLTTAAESFCLIDEAFKSAH